MKNRDAKSSFGPVVPEKPAPGQRPVSRSAVRRKRAGVEGLELGDAEMPPVVRSKVMQLMDELDRMSDELAEARERVSELENMADEDPLVPLLNRRGFMRELERALAYAARYGSGGCLVFCDLDGFKAINDRFGHAAGDAALRLVAETLAGNVRRSDIVGRLGGDEFALVLHRAALADAEAKALELCEKVAAAPLTCDDLPVRLAMSAGVAEFAPGESAAELLERADRSMYAAKARRRDRA